MSDEMRDLTDEQLEAELTSWAGRLAAGECRFLVLLGEFDAREGYVTMGMPSAAVWARWRLGLSSGTAREKLRVAKALRVLPQVRERMSQGQLSYSQVRAITRIATPEDEGVWVELAQVCNGQQIERAICGVRRAKQDDAPAAQEARQSLQMRWDDNGDLLLTCRISAANAPAVQARIEQAQQAEQNDRDILYAALTDELRNQTVDVPAGTPEPPPYAEPYQLIDPEYPELTPLDGPLQDRPPHEQAALDGYWAERRRRQARAEAARVWQEYADAQAATRALPGRWAGPADGLIRALTRPEGLKPTTVHLHTDPLSGWARTDKDDLLPPSTLAQIVETLPGRAGSTSSSGISYRPMMPEDRKAADLGRTSRLVSPALRRLLGQLDGERCRFPGCDRTRNLHAHHVIFWRDGGPTDLANLVLVCQRHHTLVHAQGFQLVLGPDDRTLTVRTADDIPVPHHPTPPTGDPDQLPAAAPFTAELTGDPFSLEFVVWVTAQHTG